jgi:hypothetical protein
MTMANDERMQRESSLIAAIRKKLPEFVRPGKTAFAVIVLTVHIVTNGNMNPAYLEFKPVRR